MSAATKTSCNCVSFESEPPRPQNRYFFAVSGGGAQTGVVQISRPEVPSTCVFMGVGVNDVGDVEEVHAGQVCNAAHTMSTRWVDRSQLKLHMAFTHAHMGRSMSMDAFLGPYCVCRFPPKKSIPHTCYRANGMHTTGQARSRESA